MHGKEHRVKSCMMNLAGNSETCVVGVDAYLRSTISLIIQLQTTQDALYQSYKQSCILFVTCRIDKDMSVKTEV